jgi:hypothetical protein
LRNSRSCLNKKNSSGPSFRGRPFLFGREKWSERYGSGPLIFALS